jgi:hemerythrin superfamily protein
MSPRKTSSKLARKDAVQLLIADHRAVKALFRQYDKLVKEGEHADRKGEAAQQICAMLVVHTTVEEELFYPAARIALGEDDALVDEAEVEHASARDLIRQIEGTSPTDPTYDAKVKVLGEYIDHHVREEEGEMFPKLRKTDLDLGTLGAEMAERKAMLSPEAVPA